jgi:hypothetical protein
VLFSGTVSDNIARGRSGKSQQLYILTSTYQYVSAFAKKMERKTERNRDVHARLSACIQYMTNNMDMPSSMHFSTAYYLSLVLSCLVLPCLVLPCLALSCLVLSCLLLSHNHFLPLLLLLLLLLHLAHSILSIYLLLTHHYLHYSPLPPPSLTDQQSWE